MTHHQMGTIPEGLYGDYDQMGVIPEGLGHSMYSQMGGLHNQLGHIPAGLGVIPSGLGFMDKFNALSTTHKVALGAGVVVVGALVLKQMGVIKELPLIG